MTLIENLYKIEFFAIQGELVNAKIKINKQHEIYKGHFPQNPITPGVIQVQIIKELLFKALNKNLLFKRAKDIKFLSMHNPEMVDYLEIYIKQIPTNANIIFATGKIFYNDIIFLKFNGEFISI